MSMKTLLWKDYRQNRKILVGIAIILAIPYVMTFYYPLFSRSSLWEDLMNRIAAGAICALVLSVGMTAFLSGNAIAGERADRSAEFAAYLPIRRRDSLISKTVFTIGISSSLFLFNLAVLRMVAPWAGQVVPENVAALVQNAFVSAILLFGVAWLFSSVTSSPAMSAAAGLAAFFIVVSTLAMLENKQSSVGHIPERPFTWYPTICIAIGLAAFLTGCLYGMLRKTP
jgi:ABC-type transport system involved in multi-copper enzyme maturation permease subunit